MSPDRPKRQVSWAWLLSMTGGALFVAWQTWVAIQSISNGYGALFPAIFAIIVVLTGILLAVWTRPQLVRLRALRRMFLDKVVVGVQHHSSTGDHIAELLGIPFRMIANGLGTYSVLVADPEGLSFWRGRGKPYRKYLVPWSMVTAVELSSQVYARPLPVVSFDATNGDKSITFTVAPCREGWRVGFAELKPDAAMALCKQLNALRQPAA